MPTPENIEIEGNQHFYSPNPGVPAITLHAKTGHTGPLVSIIDENGAQGLPSSYDMVTTSSMSSIHDRSPLVFDQTTGTFKPYGASPQFTPAGVAEMYLPFAPAATGWSAGPVMRPLHLDMAYVGTDPVSHNDNVIQGLTSSLSYGDATHAAVGTAHTFSGRYAVKYSGDALNEHAVWFGYLRYESTVSATPGRAWFTDWAVHGAIAVQQSKLDGITMWVNNYYNGSPLTTASAAAWLGTKQGSGAGITSAHTAAQTYPVDVGLGIVGTSGLGGTVTKGFTTGLQVGGSGSGWSATSRIGTGIKLSDYDTYALRVTAPYSGTTPPAIVVDKDAGYSGFGVDTVGGTAPKAPIDAYGTQQIASESNKEVAGRFATPSGGQAVLLVGGSAGAADAVWLAFHRGRLGYNGGTLTLDDITPSSGVTGNKDIVIKNRGVERFFASGTDGSVRVGNGSVNVDASGNVTAPHLGGGPVARAFLRSGQYSYTSPTNSQTTSVTYGNGNLRVTPWYVPIACTITRIGVEVTLAGDAASTIVLAIYSDDGTGMAPGALLLDASASGSASTILNNGLIAGNSATVQEVTVSQALQPGIYWIGGALQGVTVTQPTVRIVNTTSWAFPTGTTIPTANQAANVGWTQGGVTGSLPGTFTASPSASGQGLRTFVKVS